MSFDRGKMFTGSGMMRSSMEGMIMNWPKMDGDGAAGMGRMGMALPNEEIAHLHDKWQEDESSTSMVRQLAKDLRISSEQLTSPVSGLNSSSPSPVAVSACRRVDRASQQDINDASVAYRLAPMLRDASSMDSFIAHASTSACSSSAHVSIPRSQLDALLHKVGRLQTVEKEVDKIQSMYVGLQQSTSKRERLEGALRCQLEREKQTLLNHNQKLRDQVESLSKQVSLPNSSSPGQRMVLEEEYTATIESYQMAVARLTAQNKELVEGRKRQEIELAAQRATLDEQRNHINILDSALTSAQANQQSLQEELRKRTAVSVGSGGGEAGRMVRELQQNLINLQTAASKREQMDQRTRQHLEHQLTQLRRQVDHHQPDSCLGKHHHPDIIRLQTTMERLEGQVGEKDASPQVQPTQVAPFAESVSGSSASTVDLPSISLPSAKNPLDLSNSQLWQV